MVMASDL